MSSNGELINVERWEQLSTKMESFSSTCVSPLWFASFQFFNFFKLLFLDFICFYLFYLSLPWLLSIFSFPLFLRLKIFSCNYWKRDKFGHWPEFGEQTTNDNNILSPIILLSCFYPSFYLLSLSLYLHQKCHHFLLFMSVKFWSLIHLAEEKKWQGLESWNSKLTLWGKRVLNRLKGKRRRQDWI